MKNLSTRWVVVIAFLLAVFCAAMPVRAEDGDAPPFSYDISLQAPLLMRPMLEKYLDLYRWRDKERMDAAALKRLVRLAPEQIAALLSTEGYYAPTIKVELLEAVPTWQVQLIVEPNQAVRVRGIDIQVDGATSAAEPFANFDLLSNIRRHWSLPKGEIFRHPDWESAKRAALTQLLINRFPAANIKDSRASIHRDDEAADLFVQLDTGPAFTFGELEIQGLQRYPDTVIRNLNPIKVDAPYAQDQLLLLQSRLQDSPYFSESRVRAETNPEQPLRIPVQVAVTESPSKKLGFGVGFTTDIGAHTQVDYRDLNVLGKAWQWDSTLKVNQKKQTLASDITLPISADGTRDSMNTAFERTNIEGEVTRKFSLEPKRTWVDGRVERSLGVRYLTETQEVDGVPTKQNRSLSPSASWTLRATNNAIFPTQGYLLNLQVNVASKAVFSDQNFFRALARGVYYLPLGKANQLIARGEWGAVLAASRDGIPSDLLFRSGGDQSVRGYAYQSLGVSEGGGIVGGRYVAVASVEAVHWFSDKWGAALFVDAGNAADDTAMLKPVYGYGSGVRWKSAIGPLSLDLAYGQATRKIRVHFSLGVNF